MRPVNSGSKQVRVLLGYNLSKGFHGTFGTILAKVANNQYYIIIAMKSSS